VNKHLTILLSIYSRILGGQLKSERDLRTTILKDLTEGALRKLKLTRLTMDMMMNYAGTQKTMSALTE
jgi:CRISPR/Cas system-associated protein endoribonuclease Cas2